MIEFKTTKLKVLSIESLRLICVDQPETLRHLVIGDYEEAVESFINLEILVLDNIDTLNENVLNVFGSLRELYLNHEFNYQFDEYDYAEFKKKIGLYFQTEDHFEETRFCDLLVECAIRESS